jgi:hypothetical protein
MSAATGSIQYRAGELAADRFIHMTGTLAGVVGSAILVGIAAGVATGGPSPRASPIPFASSRCSVARQPTTSPPTEPDEGFCDNLIMRDLSDVRRYLHPVYDVPTAWRLGDRNDSRGPDWSGHRSRHEADLSTSYRSSFDRCLPSALGWIILVGMRPMLSSIDARPAVLIGVGGVLYSVGTRFHLWRALRSTTQYGTASCWSRQAVITQLFCMA